MRSNYDFTVGSVSCSATWIPIGFRRMVGSDQIRSGPVLDSSTWASLICSVSTSCFWKREYEIFYKSILWKVSCEHIIFIYIKGWLDNSLLLPTVYISCNKTKKFHIEKKQRESFHSFLFKYFFVYVFKKILQTVHRVQNTHGNHHDSDLFMMKSLINWLKIQFYIYLHLFRRLNVLFKHHRLILFAVSNN